MLYYTLVELNVTRPLHKMRSDSKYWCEEAIRRAGAPAKQHRARRARQMGHGGLHGIWPHGGEGLVSLV